jgi:hypothetical protein
MEISTPTEGWPLTLVPFRMRTALQLGGCGWQRPGSGAGVLTPTSARAVHLDSDGIAASTIERFPVQSPLADPAAVLAGITRLVDFGAA